MKNFKDLQNQIFEKVVHEMYLKQRRIDHLELRKKQIKYLKQKQQTFFYFFAAKYSKKSVFSLDKNLFI